ncbi:MAG: sensor histidine kinase [Candidatus Nanopelagicales bacterium]
MTVSLHTAPGPAGGPPPVVVAIRAGVVTLCVGIAALTGNLGETWPQLVALAGIAGVASLPSRSLLVRTLLLLAEAGGVAAVLVLVPGSNEPVLPYLIVPPLVAGLQVGLLAALAAAVVSASVLVVGSFLVEGSAEPPDVADLALWLLLGLAMGLVGIAVRSVQERAGRSRATYEAANRLLSELREIARQLPTGLDEVSLAQSTLSRIRQVLHFDRAALIGLGQNESLVPLAFSGADRLDWDPRLGRTIWGQAWSSGVAVQRLGSFSRPVRGVSAVIPLRVGERRTGLIGLEREGPAWTIQELAQAQAVADDAALRIDTGRMFSEVRALATVEERRRVAREIHDGVAQEVASLGYVVDDLSARAKDDPELREDLATLRGELTRIVTELRLSIFDLRSDVQPSTGLGAALSSYLRSMGTGSGITVHLVLEESATRLGVEAETELLRIAQEAITNARKHAEARNLWVTCRVDPPRAFLRIADDGRGMGSARPDSYGLEIMRERALRLGATLTIRPRVGGGTVVETTLGPEMGTRQPQGAVTSA